MIVRVAEKEIVIRVRDERLGAANLSNYECRDSIGRHVEFPYNIGHIVRDIHIVLEIGGNGSNRAKHGIGGE